MKINFDCVHKNNIIYCRKTKKSPCSQSFTANKACINFDILYETSKYLRFSKEDLEELKSDTISNQLKAVILAKLIQDGLLTFDCKNENFKDLYKNHFKDAISKIPIDEKAINNIVSYVDSNEINFFSPYVQKILPEIKEGAYRNYKNSNLTTLEYIEIMRKTSTQINDKDVEAVKDFLEKGYSLKTALDLLRHGIKKTGIDYKKVLAEIPSPETKIALKKMQNKAGYIVQTNRTGYDKEFNSYIRITKSFFEDGTILIQRSETTPKNKTYASIKGPDITVFFNTEHDGIKDLLEFNWGKNLYNSEITYTTPSNKLKGAYEISKFNLQDYPQYLNVPSLIMDGALKSGNKISSVRKEDKIIRFEEKYNQNKTSTKRTYIQEKNSNGEIIKTEYSYVIEDENSKKLLNLNRVWEKISDTKTITKINDRTFETVFDDEKMTATVTDKTTGEITVIDIKEKLFIGHGKITKKFSEFFDFCKTLNADALLAIEMTADKIKISSDPCFINNDFERKLEINSSKGISYHEIGHAFDSLMEEQGLRITDSELIDTYNFEMEQFRKNNPAILMKFIEYFSQTGGGGGKNTGLSEFIAETYVLLNTYGHEDENDLITRAHFLVRYFPKTIAKITQNFGY